MKYISKILSMFTGKEQTMPFPKGSLSMPYHLKWRDWPRIKKKYYVGRRFCYCQRSMIVIRHREGQEAIYAQQFSRPGIPPSITAEYADNHGVIHRRDFWLGDWPMVADK